MDFVKIQRGNQNPFIEEEQTTQWPKERVQKNKQRSTKHAYKTKDRVIRTPLKTGVNSSAPEGSAKNAIMTGKLLRFVLNYNHLLCTSYKYKLAQSLTPLEEHIL
jgi:hypothetical protein